MQDFATIHISNQNHVYVAAVMLLVENWMMMRKDKKNDRKDSKKW